MFPSSLVTCSRDCTYLLSGVFSPEPMTSEFKTYGMQKLLEECKGVGRVSEAPVQITTSQRDVDESPVYRGHRSRAAQRSQ